MRLGVDVGGTFTDVAWADGDEVRIAKVASTPGDQSEGILDGIDQLELDLALLERFVHGTTVATNTALERDGADVVLVTTAGFRDLLEIGRQDRPSLYDLTAQRPAPLVRAARVVEAEERITAEGDVAVALTDTEIDRVVRAVRDLEPEAVAISLLFSFLDDRHEVAIAEALGDDVPVFRSSAVLPVFREFERTSTTALNAYLAPRMARYLDRLSTRLSERGLTRPVEVMRSGGGTYATELAAELPVHTVLSGPAAGAWGAAAAGTAVGESELIAFDMGGTSTDVTLITGGRPTTTAEGDVGGLPFAVRTTDIHTVGSGGGSIGWVDDGGALRVGPRSAGADPGPACYGRGGTDATVTDANVLLGRLPADAALGGQVALDPALAEEALARLGEELGLSALDAAEGIVRVVEAQMVQALRVVSVEKGQDPRRFTLVPFGGAGPLHQAALAAELGCERVLVPPSSGVLSALGLLAAPAAVDEVRTRLAPVDTLSAEDLVAVWDDLEGTARDRFEQQGAEVARVTRSADLRYRGQAFELEVEADGAVDDAPRLGELADRFHGRHEERYGYAQRDETVELVNLRARVEGPEEDLPLPRVADGRGADAARIGRAPVHLDGDEVDVPVYDRRELGAGDGFAGPAIVVAVDTTCFVSPDQTVEVDDVGNLLVSWRDR
ncbi:MAG: hydantoinase/oxoprolinase family protein [Nitriliruptorales bacterium]|nr:hydantoinase/oxoprolinase family protein [Nitriliruptorales bacterium]